MEREQKNGNGNGLVSAVLGNNGHATKNKQIIADYKGGKEISFGDARLMVIYLNKVSNKIKENYARETLGGEEFIVRKLGSYLNEFSGDKSLLEYPIVVPRSSVELYINTATEIVAKYGKKQSKPDPERGQTVQSASYQTPLPLNSSNPSQIIAA